MSNEQMYPTAGAFRRFSPQHPQLLYRRSRQTKLDAYTSQRPALTLVQRIK